MLLHKGRDISADVKFCTYNSKTKKYDVTFSNGKKFSYNYSSLIWLNDPKILNPANIRIENNGCELTDISSIHVFSGSSIQFWRIRFIDGCVGSYNRTDLKITTSCLIQKEALDCLKYLRQLSGINELRLDNGEYLLKKQYDNLEFIGNDTALAVYLNYQNLRPIASKSPFIIFPFGGNASQFEAVSNALNNQISVIQGPPGTGKTQTILNIIANLLIQGKTIQIVSNNNSATNNIFEKLSAQKFGMDFLVAQLGNSENKSDFLKNQTGQYPDLHSWISDSETLSELRSRISLVTNELKDIYIKQERHAKLRQERKELELEIKYFRQYCDETGYPFEDNKNRNSIKSERLMHLWHECYDFSEKGKTISFWFKIKSILYYKISDWNFYKNSLPTIITHLQKMFYETKLKEITEEIEILNIHLQSVNAKYKIEQLTDLSLQYLRGKISEKYGNFAKRKIFAYFDLTNKSNEFIQEYPIILSTTFSSRSSLSKDTIYDFLIMDEASQVDITTGALALSGAKNAVIVGDLRQLPNVITTETQKRADAIFDSFNFQEGYSYSQNSFLKSVCSVMPGVPQILLREHYRCHPKIIGFCNQKFYNNELLIMTEDHGEPDALSIYKTVVGNHKRDQLSQRQIDVICKEALPSMKQVDINNIGIISPYNAQVDAIKKQLGSNTIDVATVHKFQGREKDAIIMTTVDDMITKFSDDPYLLNVAVSRAKKNFCLVVSGNEQPKDSNIGDLISYIEYNNFKTFKSEIYSVFDYLYRQYTVERMEYLKRNKRISEYDSENLMYITINNILSKFQSLCLNVICHQPLNMLIRDPRHLSDEECEYAMNPAAHVDFMIYNKISKKPVLAIEVDGFKYHKEGTRQAQRDKMKDHIFKSYNIPLLRLPTNGSGEREKIEEMLTSYKKANY